MEDDRCRKVGVELTKDQALLRWCPTTSVDCERVFSRYKKVLQDDRHNLDPDNINKIMVAKCFYSRLDADEFETHKQMQLVKKEFRKFKRQSK